jgi:putative Mg2+ transporter-C (MgtC) family protein
VWIPDESRTMIDIELQWNEILTNLVLLGAAYVLALPVAWNREKVSRSAGLRTYPMVAMASCALMLIGIKVMTSTGAEARVMEAVITGMGFIGGGAILKSNVRVSGMATAASLWATGALGSAVAWRHFEIAIVLSVMTFITLAVVPSAKKYINGEDAKQDEA